MSPPSGTRRSTRDCGRVAVFQDFLSLFEKGPLFLFSLRFRSGASDAFFLSSAFF